MAVNILQPKSFQYFKESFYGVVIEMVKNKTDGHADFSQHQQDDQAT